MPTFGARRSLNQMPPTWPLVGRGEELEFVEHAIARPGGAVIIAGPAGVGKTRLVLEGLNRAKVSGLATEWAAATFSAASIPFGATGHLLPEAVEGSGRLGLFQKVVERLAERAAGRRFVIGVDDAHLLDEPSASLLFYLVEAGSACVIAAVRAGEPAPDAVVRLWKDGLAERVDLQPLSRLETHELVEAALGSQIDGASFERLWKATQGNPLFLRELVFGALETGNVIETDGVWRWQGTFVVAPRLAELVEGRLGQLHPSQRAVLELVAVGEPLPAGVLQSLVEPALIETAERSGLLQVREERRRLQVGLSHPLYGEVIRARIPPLASRTINRRLAEALEGTGARRREDLLRLAAWRLESGTTEGPDVLVAAARRAMGVFDFRLAERFARAAVDSGYGFEAIHALSEAMIGRGAFADAEDVLSELEASSEGEQQRAQAAITRANNLFWHLGRGPAARAAIERAESAVVSQPVRDGLAAARATYLLFEGHTDQAIGVALQILDRPNADEVAALQAAMTGTWALIMAGRLERATALITRVLPLARVHTGDVPFASDWFAKSLCFALHYAGSLSEGLRVGEQAYQEALERNSDSARAMHAFALGEVTRTQGNIRSAARWFREATVVFRDVDMFNHLSGCLGELAHTEALLGNVTAAEHALAEVEVRRESGPDSFRMAEALIGRGSTWTAAARGEISRAISLAVATAEAAGSMGQHAWQAMSLHDALRLGERKVAPELARLSEIVDGPLIAAFARHADAVLVTDVHALEQTSRTFEELGALLFAAEVAAEVARIHRDAGRRSSALAWTTRARMLATHCEGASTPPLAEISGPIPLTRREREIAAMAAQGISSRDIAARLVVSVRTVDNHLYNIYSKLEVSGRDQLAPILELVPQRRRDPSTRI